MEKESYRCIIQKVVPNGNHGPYAVASEETLGLVTFSLESSVWSEKNWPEPGTYVVLSQVIKKRAGWRANSGRFFRPSDEKPETKHKEWRNEK